ncbi:hypothetical protein HMPREF7215_2594 [Pyramidobacter piscolens W5455]|uniref:Uncharacterized protein n=1 Tax=Pyramidobacter piscolens W5455 TaxID=352165 RepID=A0ABM9ZSI3_9BACT|nr:hypothetical protein [Pyramidobacter piscolens]EFB89780.1 hypothetical protein HMPREF7215_2594 [Pyramidobacter piscolens W5455]
MTRIVKDLDQRVVTSASRSVTDSYARPYYHNDTRLQSLAGALGRFLPAFVDYDRQKKDEQYRKEVAEGWALAQKYSGRGYSVEEFRSIVENDGAEKFRRLTKAREHGVNQFQMMEMTGSLAADMDDWFKHKTFVDQNGNELPIADVQDPAVFDRLFNQEVSRRVQEKTGGQYDARLFQEYFTPRLASIHNQVTQQFLQKRASALLFETQQKFTEAMNAVLEPNMNSKAFYGSPSQWIKDNSPVLNHALDVFASQSSREEAAAMGAAYLISHFHEGMSDQAKETWRSFYKSIPLLRNDPRNVEKIEDALNTANWQWNQKQERLRSEARYNQLQAQKAQEDAVLKAFWEKNFNLNTEEGRQGALGFMQAFPKQAGALSAALHTQAYISQAKREGIASTGKAGLLSDAETADLLRTGQITAEDKELYDLARNTLNAKIDAEIDKNPNYRGYLGDQYFEVQANGQIKRLSAGEAYVASCVKNGVKEHIAKEIEKTGVRQLALDPEKRRAVIDRAIIDFVQHRPINAVVDEEMKKEGFKYPVADAQRLFRASGLVATSCEPLNAVVREVALEIKNNPNSVFVTYPVALDRGCLRETAGAIDTINEFLRENEYYIGDQRAWSVADVYDLVRNANLSRALGEQKTNVNRNSAESKPNTTE